jgi:hypothetical protein
MAQKDPQLDDLMCVAPEHARRFVRLVLTLAVAALLAPAVLTYLVDPLDLYGSPVALTSRIEPRRLKADLLARAAPPPQLLILGSSWVRTLDPQYVESLFGLTAFNASVSNGSFGDWIAFTRYAVDELGYPLRVLLVGVDPGAYVAPLIRHDDAVHVPQLRRHLEHPVRAYWRSRRLLWSAHQVTLSAQVLASAVRHWIDRGSGASRDGLGFDSGPVTDPRDWREDGFDINARGRSRSQPAERIVEDRRWFYSNQTEVQPDHVASLNLLLDYCSAHQIEVITFVTVLHPDLAAQLEDTSAARIRLQAAEITQSACAGRMIYCDIDSLPYDWGDFEDLHHPGVVTGRQVVRALRTCWSGEDG